MSSSSASRARNDARNQPGAPEPIYAPEAPVDATGHDADFIFCPVTWDGPGGTYDLARSLGVGSQVVFDHTCAKHLPGHSHHVCCCGAALDLFDDATVVTNQ